MFERNLLVVVIDYNLCLLENAQLRFKIEKIVKTYLMAYSFSLTHTHTHTHTHARARTRL